MQVLSCQYQRRPQCIPNPKTRLPQSLSSGIVFPNALSDKLVLKFLEGTLLFQHSIDRIHRACSCIPNQLDRASPAMVVGRYIFAIAEARRMPNRTQCALDRATLIRHDQRPCRHRVPAIGGGTGSPSSQSLDFRWALPALLPALHRHSMFRNGHARGRLEGLLRCDA